MVRAKRGKSKHKNTTSQRGFTKVAFTTSSRGGFDGPLIPPTRQTASIFRQPVTLVNTMSKETKPVPATEIKNGCGRADKPRQMFLLKRLENLRAMLLRIGSDPNSAVPEPVMPPIKIMPVGPDLKDEIACLSLASALQNPTPGLPITGQTGPKKSLDSNPCVYTNPDQPFVQAVVINDSDVTMQERRVLDARKRLEEGLKNFG